MNWSLPNFSAPSNAEEIYKQMCGRNGVDVVLVNNAGSEEGKGIVENNVTDDVAHSIFQLGSLARKKFAQHFQPGRKLVFTPATFSRSLNLIRSMRLISLRMIRFNSSTHFICNMVH